MQLILGSSSKARQQLLQRLMLPFIVAVPNVDETIQKGESAEQVVERLALAKAQAVSRQYPKGLIIGCDQVGLINDQILNKPNDAQHAHLQLQNVSGQEVLFLTALCLLDTSTQQFQLAIESYTVRFRLLSDDMIQAYLVKEKPFACAGSFQIEGLGISLIESLAGNDYTALIGLPLIRLTTMLNAYNLGPLQVKK